ncbi:hypothetical protein TanjilG_27741 [Lupinus angustifolius]|uniref:Uncharacterized protein n=1 Tax=Lupinus angustifolius TaxID=3871 RepID=A0A4P1RI21_LUPAN|nr:hypothetical protein TanjilG_27741 [Lupinus angustifolius]
MCATLAVESHGKRWQSDVLQFSPLCKVSWSVSKTDYDNINVQGNMVIKQRFCISWTFHLVRSPNNV